MFGVRKKKYRKQIFYGNSTQTFEIRTYICFQNRSRLIYTRLQILMVSISMESHLCRSLLAFAQCIQFNTLSIFDISIAHPMQSLWCWILFHLLSYAETSENIAVSQIFWCFFLLSVVIRTKKIFHLPFSSESLPDMNSFCSARRQRALFEFVTNKNC